jgi:hypothetical protein
MAACTLTAAIPCTMQTGREAGTSPWGSFGCSFFQPVPARIAAVRLLLDRWLSFLGGGRCDLPFQRKPERAVHGTARAKGVARA